MVNVAGLEIHDIAIVDVTFYPTIVKPGGLVSINVTVFNEGTVSETFSVAVYYGTHIIENRTGSSEAGVNTTLTFTWDTTDVAVRSYTISAQASVVPGESDTADNFKSALQRIDVTSATVYVNPLINTASPGDSFDVNINVAGVKATYAFGFKLNWSNPVLDATSVTEGDFLNDGGVYATDFIKRIHNEENPDSIGESGYLIVSCTLKGQPASASASGSGTLITVTFLVESKGESALHIYPQFEEYNYMLWNYDVKEIPHLVEDGSFAFPLPILYVDPQILVDPTKLPGETFTVNVNVTDVTNLYGFEFYLSYNSTLLNATEVSIVPFLNEPYKANVTNIDPIIGVSVRVISDAPAEPVNGSAPLATITFRIEDKGMSTLGLYNTTLLDPSLAKIAHATMNGTFANVRLGSSIFLTVYPTSIVFGESVTLNGTITPSRSGVDVTIWYRLAGSETWDNLTTVQTDQNSQYSYTWTPQQTGTYEIKASWPGDFVTEAAESIPQTVAVQATQVIPLEVYIIAGVVIVAVAGILIYFMRIRKHKGA